MTDYYKNRLYLIINLVVFIDTLLYGIIVPAVPHFVKTFRITQTMVGVVFVAYSAGLLLSSIPIGVLCDRIGRTKVLFYGAIGLATATVIYMISNSLYMLISSRFLQGVASSATWTAGLALVADMFPKSNRGQKLGLVLSSAGLGTIVGPAFGGVLFSRLGFAYPFLIIAVIALTPIFFLFKQMKSADTGVKNKISNQFSIMNKVVGNRNLLWGAFTVSISSFGVGIIDPILPLHLSEHFNLTTEEIGIIFSVLGISYSVSQPVMGGLADRIGRKKVMIVGLFVTALVCPFITLAQTLILQGLTVVLFGISTGMISAPCLPLMAESVYQPTGEINDNMYGMAFGVLNTAYSLGLVIGPVFGGVITERLNFTYAMSFYSLFLIVTGIGVARFVCELRFEPFR